MGLLVGRGAEQGLATTIVSRLLMETNLKLVADNDDNNKDGSLMDS